MTSDPAFDDVAYLRAELALVGLYIERAMAVGHSRGWHDIASEQPARTELLLSSLLHTENQVVASREISPLRMDLLRTRFSLTRTEQRVIWTLIAFELDPKLRRMLRSIASEPNSSLSTGTILDVVYGDDHGTGLVELGPDSRLATYCLIQLGDVANSASQRRIQIADRVLELATGATRADPALLAFARFEPIVAEPMHLEIASDAAERVKILLSRHPTPGTLVAHGSRGFGRRSFLIQHVHRAGKSVITVDAHRLSPQREHTARELRIVARECRIIDAVPLIINLEALQSLGDTPDRLDLLESTFADFTLILATAATQLPYPWKRNCMFIEFTPITTAQREKLWSTALPMATASDVEYLTDTYPLAPNLIEAVGRAAVAASTGVLTAEDFTTGVRSVLDDRLAGKATRLTVTQHWKDLILASDQTLAMIELLARIRQRRTVYEE